MPGRFLMAASRQTDLDFTGSDHMLQNGSFCGCKGIDNPVCRIFGKAGFMAKIQDYNLIHLFRIKHWNHLLSQ